MSFTNILGLISMASSAVTLICLCFTVYWTRQAAKRTREAERILGRQG